MRSILPCLLLVAACGGDDATPPGDDVVEDTVPDTRFTATPGADLDNADDSVFGLACDGGPCTFECSVDDGAFAACDEALALAYLAVGEHTLAARAIDGDGDVDETPVVHTWSLAFAWRELAGARSTMCAIAGDGALYCWGHESYGGELGNGGGVQDSLAVATRIGGDAGWSALVAGYGGFCAHRDGATWCWGANWDDQLGDPAIVDHAAEPTMVVHDFAQLSLGDDHGCGIDAAGALSCWGAGYYGRLGLGDEVDHDTPQQVGTATWAQVAAGSESTCAIDTAGGLWCWGANDLGQAAQDPVTDQLLVPTRVGGRTDWAQVSLGGGHACALDDAGGLWCWGGNYRGQLGDGTTTPTFTPIQVAGAWRDVLASDLGTCAIATTGAVSCWGDNQRAQLGSAAPVAQSTTPRAIADIGVYTAVVGPGDLHCALGDRDILCWGDNRNASGGLGRGVFGGEPQVIELDGGWTKVATNPNGGCGTRTDGTLACWGLGFHVGQDVALAYAPTPVSANMDWIDVDVTADGSLARGHACGLRGGAAWCWGTNAEGQLGDGTTTLRTRPVEVVVPGESLTQISTGAYSTCVISAAGHLFCWGGGTNITFTQPNWGQVGDGTQVERDAPVQITQPSVSGWVSVSVVGRRTTALRSDGTVWAWGLNTNGVAQLTPAQIGADTDWAAAISTVDGWTCARKTSGALYCGTLVYSPGWARAMIQVGTATDHGALVPFEGGVCSLRAGVLHCYWGTGDGWTDNFPNFDVNGTIPNPSGTWASFSAGYTMRCGVRTDGTRACAGARFAGSLGDGFDERQPTAIERP